MLSNVAEALGSYTASKLPGGDAPPSATAARVSSFQSSRAALSPFMRRVATLARTSSRKPARRTPSTPPRSAASPRRSASPPPPPSYARTPTTAALATPRRALFQTGGRRAPLSSSDEEAPRTAPPAARRRGGRHVSPPGTLRQCARHMEPVSLYSMTAGTLVCAVCARLPPYSTHDLVDLVDAARHHRAGMAGTLETASSMAAILGEAHAAVLGEIAALDDAEAARTADLKGSFSRMRRALDASERRLQAELTADCARHRNTLNARLASLTEKSKRVRGVLGRVQPSVGRPVTTPAAAAAFLDDRRAVGALVREAAAEVAAGGTPADVRSGASRPVSRLGSLGDVDGAGLAAAEEAVVAAVEAFPGEVPDGRAATGFESPPSSPLRSLKSRIAASARSSARRRPRARTPPPHPPQEEKGTPAREAPASAVAVTSPPRRRDYALLRRPALTVGAANGRRGVGPSTFNYPMGIAAGDGDATYTDRLFVVDHGNARVQRLRDNGTAALEFGKVELKAPRDVAPSGDGTHVYVTDNGVSGTAAVHVYGVDGSHKREFGSDRLRSPYGVAVAAPGSSRVDVEYVLVADKAARCVLAFRGSGRFHKYLGQGHLVAPYGVAVSGADVYVSDADANTVLHMGLDGSALRRLAAPGVLAGPACLAVRDGVVAVACTAGDAVVVLDAETGARLASIPVEQPCGVAVTEGGVFVTSLRKHCLQVFT